ncbi:MAG: hypothetical protein MUE49_04140 [Rhodospirillales bacterium]|jgi:hypothetical protein|nr:hypothetical protein [Rhodospirillales bacterium]
MAARQRRGHGGQRIAAAAVAVSLVAACASPGDREVLHGPPAGGWDQPRIQLTGLGPAQLDALLGPPQFKRKDGPARLMQYRNDACVLDVFVYENTATGESRVEHVQARDHGLRGMPETTCLAALLRSRKPSRAS